ALARLLGGVVAPRFDVEPDAVYAVALAALWAGLACSLAAAIVLRRRPALAAWPALVLLIAGFSVTLLGAIGVRAAVKTSRDLASAIRQETAAGEQPLVVSYRRLMQSLSFYTGRRVTMLDPSATYNEITAGALSAPDYEQYFWRDVGKLRDEWASGR